MSFASLKSKAGNAVFSLSLVFGAVAIGAAVLAFPTAKMGINPLFTDRDGAVEVVENHGFTNARATGYGWFSCGVGENSDLWRTRFTATNQNGKEVTGVVCAGFFKGGTMRLDN